MMDERGLVLVSVPWMVQESLVSGHVLACVQLGEVVSVVGEGGEFQPL